MDSRVRTVHTCGMTRRYESLLMITAAVALASVVAITSIASFWTSLIP